MATERLVPWKVPDVLIAGGQSALRHSERIQCQRSQIAFAVPQDACTRPSPGDRWVGWGDSRFSGSIQVRADSQAVRKNQGVGSTGSDDANSLGSAGGRGLFQALR